MHRRDVFFPAVWINSILQSKQLILGLQNKRRFFFNWDNHNIWRLKDKLIPGLILPLFPPISSLQPTLSSPGKLPAVNHILFFQTACKMMSCLSIVAGPVSAKNTCLLLLIFTFNFENVSKIKTTRELELLPHHQISKLTSF